jgi:hypothetical protein
MEEFNSDARLLHGFDAHLEPIVDRARDDVILKDSETFSTLKQVFEFCLIRQLPAKPQGTSVRKCSLIAAKPIRTMVCKDRRTVASG